MAPEKPGNAGRISSAPAIVLAAGMVLAVTVVLLGAYLASAPALVPTIASPGTAGAPRDVSVILRDYAFNPSPLYLVAGETVRFNLINGGMVEHEFVLGNASVQSAWAQADAAASPPGLLATAPPASVPAGVGGLRVLLASGQSESVLYQVSAQLVPGTVSQTLLLYCHLPGHAEKGMVGQVVLISR